MASSRKRHTVFFNEVEHAHLMSRPEADQYLATLQVWNGWTWIKPGGAYVARYTADGEWVPA